MASSFGSKWGEIWWLVKALSRTMWMEMVEWVQRVVGGFRGIPVDARQVLEPATLSRLCGRRVSRVEVDARHAALSEASASLGAGGAGTERVWLRAEFAATRKTERIFVKLPARTTFERLFLNVFGVYANEVGFYKRLLEDSEFRDKFPPSLFPRTYGVGRNRNRFVVVLEDLAGRRDAVLPTVADPHPVSRAKSVLEALAALHAPYFARVHRAPVGWNDAYSAAPGSTPTRPPFLRLIADSSLKGLDKRFPGILSSDCRELYALFVNEFDKIRRAWSTHPHLTLVHGDAHLGNTFFSDTGCGLYDWQCVAFEHPCRDVVYHLLSSCDPSDLDAGGERALVDFYVHKLNQRLDPDNRARQEGTHDTKSPPGGGGTRRRLVGLPSGDDDALVLDLPTAESATPTDQQSHQRFLGAEEAWEQYRAHAAWVLVGFVICAGAGDHYFADAMAKLTLSRIVRGCDRLDALGALRLLVARDARRASAATPKPTKVVLSTTRLSSSDPPSPVRRSISYLSP